jgi:hypothetical protein
MKNIFNTVNDGGSIRMNIGNEGQLMMNERSEINAVQAGNGNGGALYLSQSERKEKSLYLLLLSCSSDDK